MFCRAMDSKRSVIDGKEDTKKKCNKDAQALESLSQSQEIFHD